MARIWDAYLAEEDKADLATRPVKKKRGFGKRPALLLIDLYRAVFGDEPESLSEGVKRWPSHCGMAGWNALPAIQNLLETARAAGVPVIHTTGVDDARDLMWGGPSKAPIDPEAAARDARRYDIIDQVAPLPGELVIRKGSPSCLWGTPLVGYLNAMGVDTIITAGESTSGCVRASVVDGSTYRFGMVVVEDCVFDRHKASHAINLFDMNQKYADVLSLSEVLGYLTSRQPEPVPVPQVERTVAAIGAGS